MKFLRIVNSFIIMSFLLVSCATQPNIEESKRLESNSLGDQTSINYDSKVGLVKSQLDGSPIVEIPDMKIFDDRTNGDMAANTIDSSLNDILNSINKTPTSNNENFSNYKFSTVPKNLFGGWKDEKTGNTFVANFDYDFAYIFIKNEILNNRIFIFGDNSKNFKKSWLGTLDGSIVINKKTGRTNAGNDIIFSSGLNQSGNYFFNIRFDGNNEEYGCNFIYDEAIDKLFVHCRTIDSKKNKSEFDITLIRNGEPLIAVNTFICPEWLIGYNKFSKDYSLSFNKGQFEIIATNSHNQKFYLIFDEYNKLPQSDEVYLNDNNVLIHMYGNENVESIDVDFFYILSEVLNKSDTSTGSLTMQIGEKKTGRGGIIKVTFQDRKIIDLGIYFLQNDGSYISFF